MYAEQITRSMRQAMDETARRRVRQAEYNEEHGIVPQTIRKSLETPFDSLYQQASEGKGKGRTRNAEGQIFAEIQPVYNLEPDEIGKLIKELEEEMRDLARNLEFERAAEVRDRIRVLRELLIEA